MGLLGWYCWWFRNPGNSPIWGKGSLSQLFTRVLAPSKRWLALGFQTNHQQCNPYGAMRPLLRKLVGAHLVGDFVWIYPPPPLRMLASIVTIGIILITFVGNFWNPHRKKILHLWRLHPWGVDPRDTWVIKCHKFIDHTSPKRKDTKPIPPKSKLVYLPSDHPIGQWKKNWLFIVGD